MGDNTDPKFSESRRKAIKFVGLAILAGAAGATYTFGLPQLLEHKRQQSEKNKIPIPAKLDDIIESHKTYIGRRVATAGYPEYVDVQEMRSSGRSVDSYSYRLHTSPESSSPSFPLLQFQSKDQEKVEYRSDRMLLLVGDVASYPNHPDDMLRRPHIFLLSGKQV